jgi:hypothetical protein
MRRIVRRRGTKQQGRALEALGHAVEYMMDSRLLLAASNPRADAEAVRLLTQASRAVFAECPEILPRRERLIRWVRTSVLSRA